MPPSAMVVDSKAEVVKPKRAASAYFLFGNSVRERLTEENKKANCGKVKVGEVAKQIGELWAKLGEKEKAKFVEQANEGKEKQAAEMKAYKEATDPLSVLKEKYADRIPKKPTSAFWLFSQDPSERTKAETALKDAGEEANHKKITTKIGEMWKALSESEKAPWNEKLKKASAEYEEKRKVWEATPEGVEFQRVEKEQKDAVKEQKEKEKAEQKEQKAKDKEAAKEEKKAAKVSPKKEGKREAGTEDTASPPSAKKAKVEKLGKASKKSKPQEPVIEADVLKKAQSLNLEAPLKNLLGRDEVKDFPQMKLLDALEKNDGLVNKAKHALLGA